MLVLALAPGGMLLVRILLLAAGDDLVGLAIIFVLVMLSKKC